MKTKATIFLMVCVVVFPMYALASEVGREELLQRLPREWAPLQIEGCYRQHWCALIQNEANTTAMGEQFLLIYSKGSDGRRALFQSRGHHLIAFHRLMYSDTYLIAWQVGTGVTIQTVSLSDNTFRQTFPKMPPEYGTKDLPSLLQDPRGPETPPLIGVHVWNACTGDEGPCADTELYRWDAKKGRYGHYGSASWKNAIEAFGKH